MTDPSRIQAIRPVHNAEMYAAKKREDLCGGQYTDEQIAFKVAMVSPRSLADIGAPEMAKDRIRWLSTQLSIARSQAKEDAALMRETADTLEQALRKFWPAQNPRLGTDPRPPFCGECSIDTPNHKPDCIITKLRTAADRVEG